MRTQLQTRENNLTEKIGDLTEACEDISENVDVVSTQLLDLNKGNLKETYVLEDLQNEHD